MKHLLLTVLLCTPCLNGMADQAAPGTGETMPHRARDAADLLRFSNGDTLHGMFLGFDDHAAIIWKSPEATEPIRFTTEKIHRVILNRARAHQQAELGSTLTLVNGDVIPCKIVAADQASISIESSHLGTLALPRNTISALTPAPYGGEILYYGPLDTRGWKTLDNAREAANVMKDGAKDAPAPEGAVENPDARDSASYWKHITNAWYSLEGKQHGYLVHENILPDRCRVSMKLAWRGTLSTYIAIHADLAPPVHQGDERSHGHTTMASMAGHAYAIMLDQYGAELHYCTYDEAGKPSIQRVDNSRTRLNLTNREQMQLELRIDRPDKAILLYVDDQFKAIWNIEGEYQGKGSALGFCNTRYMNSTLRISDIVISAWNGLKDSAQSMRNKHRDTILLINGTDRFSGSFQTLKNDQVSFLGSYGNPFSIPVDQVQEIHLASEKFPRLIDQDESKYAHFYIPPHGRISGVPLKNTDAGTLISTHLLGELVLRTSCVNIIDFSHQNNLLDLWDDHF